MPNFVVFFSERFIQDDGMIDRQLLRQAVFDDDTIRKQLENILHPIVQAAGRRSRQGMCLHCGRMLIVEVPLLYEAGWQDAF